MRSRAASAWIWVANSAFTPPKIFSWVRTALVEAVLLLTLRTVNPMSTPRRAMLALVFDSPILAMFTLSIAPPRTSVV